MDGQWLLQADFQVTDGRLEPAQLNELSTASELLRTPMPRELVEAEHLPRRLDGATRRLTTRDRLDAADALREARARYDQAVAKRSERVRQALAIAESLIQPCNFDLSVLSIYMRAKTEVEGLLGVRFCLALTTRMLGQPWETLERELTALDAVGEQDQRVRTRNRWLAQLETVLDQLYTWCAMHPAEVHDARPGTDEVQLPDWSDIHRDLAAALERRKLTPRRWMDVRALLDDLARGVDTHEAAETAPPSSLHEPKSRPLDAPARPEPDTASAGSDAPSSGTHSMLVEGVASVRVSPQFVQLQQRLAAFGELLREGQYARASLVAADLQRTLEHFDVASYFPDLFAEFFVGSAEHAAELAQFGSSLDDPRWRALHRLYQTDLDRFLNLRLPDEAGRLSSFGRSSADGVS